MNFFCFTLEGSTESIYEPAYSQTVKEVLPKCQCSPALLRHKLEWSGSDPCLSSDQSQTPTSKRKESSRRSYAPASALNDGSLDKDINHACWMSSSKKKGFSHQKNDQNREISNTASQDSMFTRDDRAEEPNTDRRERDLPAQSSETEAETAETESLGRLRKLHKLVQAKKGQQSGGAKGRSTSEHNAHLEDTSGDNNPVLTCIGLSKRTEKKPSKPAPSSRQPQAKEIHERPEEEGLWSPRVHSPHWSPTVCPHPWTPSFHTCHQPQTEPWVYDCDFTLPRTTEWDRFESLIAELDSKQADLSPPRVVRSITDLHISQTTRSNRFGRFDAFQQHSPLMKPQDNGSVAKQVETGDLTKSRILGRETKAVSQTVCEGTGEKLVKTLPGETSEEAERDEANKVEVGSARTFTKGHRRSSNSLESLYSLTSGQSSSSGVTSGSDCSSNRGSLRLEEDLPYTRQFCGRARVHTDFVPSPYDTESLKLKVGDVIDIIAKPPMGIWTGVLNDKIGNFKFIYVDVLPHKGPEIRQKTQTHMRRQKSRQKTLQELLQHLGLEEYSSSLRLNGYQTVDDLMRLRERHLMELNVTDPEHRHRLLAAVDSLQQAQTDSHFEDDANQEAGTPGENIKADMSNCPRDSGCHMPSDSPDNSNEDTEIHFPSIHTQPAEMQAT
ncbi:SAM domain-containing protein SAMSN-1b isoform X2 [Myripristis murdjan]|uniref:SAM domain-containing protein SAMSN-1b isoform X2 n=1 Tax=Myripristis murdjan TaxID=586833 RepID=UPI00117640C4|nr:uncharacterized protein LOC115371949 isoform X2 [Myripristis murdjan]